jgi:hypothetical protein
VIADLHRTVIMVVRNELPSAAQSDQPIGNNGVSIDIAG